jgi:hypothetical protein
MQIGCLEAGGGVLSGATYLWIESYKCQLKLLSFWWEPLLCCTMNEQVLNISVEPIVCKMWGKINKYCDTKKSGCL